VPLAGGLWILAGLRSALIVFGVLDEPILVALGLGGAIVGLTIGALVVGRPGPEVVRGPASPASPGSSLSVR
jgi:hypothetical protein